MDKNNQFTDYLYLITQLKARDEDALEYVEKKYYKYIKTCIRNIFIINYPNILETKLQNRVDENYHDAWIRILTKLDQLNEKDDDEIVLRGWLWKVTRSSIKLIINNEKAEKRINESKKESESYEVLEEKGVPKILLDLDCFSNYNDQSERGKQLNEILSIYPKILDHQKALVIALFYIGGLKEKEIAKLPGFKNRDEVHHIKENAINELKKYFGSDDDKNHS